ncbi:MAG: UDP-N-acetylmuramoyl-L-alanine--D-glutamate ligase [Pseudomonadota bacterium]
MMVAEKDSTAASYDVDYAVVGLGETGRSCVAYLKALDASLLAFDADQSPSRLAEIRENLSDDDIKLGPFDIAQLSRARSIVLSPGVPLSLPVVQQLLEAGHEVIGDVELFARAAGAPIVAVTGTNGKSTVTSMIDRVLSENGFEIATGGNLGVPALDLLSGAPPDYYLLELSSFQLDLQRSLAPRVACILNISPDHLDRHGSFENYRAAKARIFDHAESRVVNADDTQLASFQEGAITFSLEGVNGADVSVEDQQIVHNSTVVAHCNDVAVSGTHNLANALAAVAVCRTLGCSTSAIRRGLAGFQGLPHRCEFVAEIGKVRFINDSKGTNPSASAMAVNGELANDSGVLIAGGRGKDLDFAPLVRAIIEHVHTVILIGEAAVEIDKEIDGRVSTIRVANLSEAVRSAFAAARATDTVLLSPGCASFDQFSNYIERGNKFRECVGELKR